MANLRPSDPDNRRCQRGATATEYALLAFFVAAAIVLVVFTFGGKVSGLFEEANSSWDSATSQE
ncbi:Flp family type IVb pilin [Nocardioides sambongensis]|uniref:Flp family type IVb pilin n=1 Tax=Nocardioides sambongensis TaxID=2589074 RepID=UPI001126D3BB|nr:Flp family type IVb pilin [Nocardioides sambongensis]